MTWQRRVRSSAAPRPTWTTSPPRRAPMPLLRLLLLARCKRPGLSARADAAAPRALADVSSDAAHPTLALGLHAPHRAALLARPRRAARILARPESLLRSVADGNGSDGNDHSVLRVAHLRHLDAAACRQAACESGVSELIRHCCTGGAAAAANAPCTTSTLTTLPYGNS